MSTRQEIESIARLRKELLFELRDKVIPWASTQGIARMVLAEFPLRLPPGIQSWRYSMPPLKRRRAGGTIDDEMVWPEFGMKTIHNPFIAFVIEGAADFRVAPTQSSGRRAKEACQVVTLSAGDAMLFPPAAPHDDHLPHWFQPHPQNAASRILWLQASRSGGYSNICTTIGTQHNSQPNLFFLSDSRLHALFEMLIDELTDRKSGVELAAQGLLLALVTRMERGFTTKLLYQRRHPKDNWQSALEGSVDDADEAESSIVQRAVKFIHGHLAYDLSPELIAQHVFVSPATLQRAFSTELGIPVMRFVTQCRMDSAQALLTETELPVAIIAQMLGYTIPTHFSRAFKSHAGMTPLECRKTLS